MSSVLELKQDALRIRAAIVAAIASKGGGHIGGSLDLADLVAVLYDEYMRVDPQNPKWDKRDYLVCSKGHAGPVLYAALALKGFFPYERLKTLNQEGSLLPGHCDRTKVPGIDVTSGSLGQGLSIANGLALAAKLKKTDQRVFCITGDGESAEGQIWEAAQFAAHYKLDNLIAFLDWNKMQIDGTNDEVMSLGDAQKKYEAFGWNSCIIDGSDVELIKETIGNAIYNKNGKPTMIVLDTLKGRGVESISSMTNNHCVGFSKQMYEVAYEDINRQASELGVDIKWLE
jgi:transketolase